MLFVVNVFAMHEQQMLAGDFLCAPIIIYWPFAKFGAYKFSKEGWDATGCVGWTEDESTSVPDAASEVCPIVKADASCRTSWPLNRLNILSGLFCPQHA